MIKHIQLTVEEGQICVAIIASFTRRLFVCKITATTKRTWSDRWLTSTCSLQSFAFFVASLLQIKCILFSFLCQNISWVYNAYRIVCLIHPSYTSHHKGIWNTPKIERNRQAVALFKNIKWLFLSDYIGHVSINRNWFFCTWINKHKIFVYRTMFCVKHEIEQIEWESFGSTK